MTDVRTEPTKAPPPEAAQASGEDGTRPSPGSDPGAVRVGPQGADDSRSLSTADIAGARDDPQRPNESDVGAKPTEDAESRVPLFDERHAQQLRGRWDGIQAGFVDEPRQAVENADALVAEVMQQLATTFASERQSLERQWTQGDDVSTEALRLALRRYRSFFGRLLSL